MKFWLILQQSLRKLCEAGKQCKHAAENVNKKSDSPFRDVDIRLFQLQESYVGLYRNINKDDPQHQERKEPEYG